MNVPVIYIIRGPKYCTYTTILNKKLAGKVSIESPDILFQSLATLLDLKITQKGKQLIIE